MKKNYIMPTTEAQVIAMGQLMIGSATPGININKNPLYGSDSEGIVFGE